MAKKHIVAAHIRDEDCHAVVVNALRVLIEKDGDGWFAQGLEIDYAAGGISIEDVKERFAEGLIETVSEHLRVFGTLDNLIHTAPDEEWKRFTSQKDQYTLSLMSLITNGSSIAAESLPFSNIAFMEPRAA